MDLETVGSSPTGHPTKNPLMLCIGGFFIWWGAQWGSNKAALTHQRQSNQQPSGLLVSLRVPISRNSTKTNAVLMLCIGGFFYLVGVSQWDSNSNDDDRGLRPKQGGVVGAVF